MYTLSAVKIQALVRGRQCRLLTEAMRIGLQAAAEKIQHAFRHRHWHTKRSSQVGVCSLAVRLIQQRFRKYLGRVSQSHQAIVTIELNEVHQIAAITIQQFWRQFVERRDQQLEEIEAATCIQALGRGHLARKSYESLRSSRSSAKVSQTVRGMKLGSNCGECNV